ncbi:MAG: hypothetical protein KC766_20740 [Myxococcales bacterium]|nr:hypothetical protein [Myxococcales bacterium]
MQLGENHRRLVSFAAAAALGSVIAFIGACGGAPPAETPTIDNTKKKEPVAEAPAPASSVDPKVVADANVDGLLASLEGSPSDPPPATPSTPPPTVPRGSPATVAPSSWRPGTFMTKALDDLSAQTVAVQRLAEEKSMTVGFDGTAATFMGAYMYPGKPVKFSRTFDKGVMYVFVSGSSRASGINISVRDMSGRQVAGGTKGTVVFVPPTAGAYNVYTEVGAGSPSSFVTLGVMRSGGLSIPVSRIQESVYGAVKKAAQLSDGVVKRKIGGGLVFHDETDWALYGTVLDKGEAIRFGGLDLKKKHVLLGSGDSASTDINLQLLDPSGRPVSSDMDPDPVAVLGFNSPSPGPYTLRVQCAGATGKSLVTAIVLTVD